MKIINDYVKVLINNNNKIFKTTIYLIYFIFNNNHLHTNILHNHRSINIIYIYNSIVYI